MPLPKGAVRVYERDHTGAQQFIGEDLIDHTPHDEALPAYHLSSTLLPSQSRASHLLSRSASLQ